MNRDSIIGFILIAIILIGYSLWMTPSKEELAEQQRKNDSIAAVNKRVQDSLLMLQRDQAPDTTSKRAEAFTDQKLPNEPGKSTTDSKLLIDRLGLFAAAGAGQEQEFTVQNDVVKLFFTNKGGKVKTAQLLDYQTYDSLPLLLFESGQTYFGLNFFAGNRSISTNELYYKVLVNGEEQDVLQDIEIGGEQILNLSFRLYLGETDSTLLNDRYLEYAYTLTGDDYMLKMQLNFVGMDQIIAANANYMDLNWFADLRQQERSIDRFNGSTIYYRFYEDDVDYLSETDDDEEALKTRVHWVAYKLRFFTAAMIADDAFDNAAIRTLTKERPISDHYQKTMETTAGIAFDRSPSKSFALSFYYGPNKYNRLKSYDLELERVIPLGWSFFLMAWINIYIVIPVFDWLGSYGWNYGIVILILTLLLKILLFPIAYKTYMSSAKMRALKPEVDELAEKFPKKEDAMKKQQATMDLYRRAGVNPMAGCVPMLLQFPILIAMFRFFPSSIELRQQKFLWANDLSSYDSIANLPFEIPFYGDHVSLFTLLMTASTIIYTYLNNQMMGQQSTQLPGMKTMMYLMPIMFLGLFNNYASGLSYYYLLANLITFAQMFVFRRSVNEEKLRKKLEQNKKKPRKKSGFQKRLEEAAKKRGYQMPKR